MLAGWLGLFLQVFDCLLQFRDYLFLAFPGEQFLAVIFPDVEDVDDAALFRAEICRFPELWRGTKR